MTRAPGVKMVAIAAGAAAGLLLAGSAVGTSARWTDSAGFSTESLRSGQLTLRTGNAGTQVADYQFTELAASGLGPGSYAQAPLTVKNAGSVNLAYKLAGASATNATLGASLRLSVKQVTAAAACATGVGVANPTGTTVDLYSGALLSAQTTARSLAPAGSEVLCIRVTIDPSIPGSLQTTASTTTFTFTATATRAG